MPRLTRFILPLIALFTSANIASAQTPSDTPPAGLNPGDQVRIVVWRNPEFSGDFAIAANGTVSHPLYREIQVTGIPMLTVEDRLRTFLTRYIANPQFVVQPLVRIIVGGEVRSPNVYSVPPETTLAQAVALAGGPTERGALNKVHVVRYGQDLVVDLTQSESNVAALQIRSGDQVLISRRGPGFRDFLSPTFSAIAATAALVNIFTR